MENLQPPVPTLQQLIKSVIVAVGIAAVLLVTAVLPAEYNIDPIGAGKLLGLNQLNGETTAPELIPSANAATAAESNSAVISFEKAFRSEQKSVVLEPFEGIEMKALMIAGEHFVFSWSTDGAAVYVDMHGERPDAGDEFTSYWKEKQQTQATGAFTAPFSGTHGWYWQNMGEEPITIQLVVSGFFEKLYIP